MAGQTNKDGSGRSIQGGRRAETDQAHPSIHHPPSRPDGIVAFQLVTGTRSAGFYKDMGQGEKEGRGSLQHSFTACAFRGANCCRYFDFAFVLCGRKKKKKLAPPVGAYPCLATQSNLGTPRGVSWWARPTGKNQRDIIVTT